MDSVEITDNKYEEIVAELLKIKMDKPYKISCK